MALFPKATGKPKSQRPTPSQRHQALLASPGIKTAKSLGPNVWGAANYYDANPDDGFNRRKNYEPAQEELLNWLMKMGKESHMKGQSGLEQLMQPVSAYDQSINRLSALANAGATPGSYGADIGAMAGTALGGPLGGLAGRIGGSLLGGAFDQYQASQAFGPYEEAARRSFERQTIPGIAERFAGQGALSSSAFQNALGGAASDLESQLATARADYSAQQMEQMMRQREMANQQVGQEADREMQRRELAQRYYQGLQNQGLRQMELGLGPRFTETYQQEEPGALERIFAPILQQATKYGTKYALNKLFPGGGELADLLLLLEKKIKE